MGRKRPERDAQAKKEGSRPRQGEWSGSSAKGKKNSSIEGRDTHLRAQRRRAESPDTHSPRREEGRRSRASPIGARVTTGRERAGHGGGALREKLHDGNRDWV